MTLDECVAQAIDYLTLELDAGRSPATFSASEQFKGPWPAAWHPDGIQMVIARLGAEGIAARCSPSDRDAVEAWRG